MSVLNIVVVHLTKFKAHVLRDEAVESETELAQDIDLFQAGCGLGRRGECGIFDKKAIFFKNWTWFICN